jgi:hypothetical protein
VGKNAHWRNKMVEKYTTGQKIWTAFKRLLRVVIPQIPAFMAAIGTYIPENYTPLLIFAGACGTALDKLLRDLKVSWYFS